MIQSSLFSFLMAVSAALLLTLPVNSTAQGSSRMNAQMEAMRHASQLRKGILLVRLQSNRNKLRKLNELIESDPGRSERWSRAYEQTVSETRENQLRLSRAIAAKYRFSKVAYIYDFQIPELRTASSLQVIVDMETNTSLDLDLQNTFWYVLSDEHISSQGPVMYRVLDKNLNIVQPPFPNRFRKNNVWNAFISAFNPKKEVHRNLDNLFEKWNQKLFRLYPMLE